MKRRTLISAQKIIIFTIQAQSENPGCFEVKHMTSLAPKWLLMVRVILGRIWSGQALRRYSQQEEREEGQLDAEFEGKSNDSADADLPVVDVATMDIKDGNPEGTDEIRTSRPSKARRSSSRCTKAARTAQRELSRLAKRCLPKLSRLRNRHSQFLSLGSDHEASVDEVAGFSSGLHFRYHDYCSLTLSLISYVWCVPLKEFERALWLCLWIDYWRNTNPRLPKSSFH